MENFDKAVSQLDEKGKEKLVKAGNVFFNAIDKIVDKDIKEFTLNALSNADYRFWIYPCSGSGKYHPPEDQGIAGIIRHNIKMISVARGLLMPFNLENDYYKDLAISSCSLHDILKNGVPWKGSTDYKHGFLAYEWLKQFQLGNGKEEIMNAVRYHMGKWCAVAEEHEKNAEKLNKEEIERALNSTPFERIIQISDYIASRKEISFMPGLEVIFNEDFREKYGEINI